MSFTFCVFARSGNPFLFRKFIARRMKGHAPLLSLDPYVDRVPNALVFHEISFGPQLRANQYGELKLQRLRSGRQSLARAVNRTGTSFLRRIVPTPSRMLLQ